MTLSSSIFAVQTASSTQVNDQSRLEEAAQAFEAIFVRNMISTMRQASIGDNLMGNGAHDQFRDMMDSRIADDAATSGSFGIAEQLVKQWKDRI